MRREVHRRAGGTPERRVITFDSLEKANEWLRSRDSILIINFHIGVAYSPAVPIRDITVRLIRFDYLLYPYGVDNNYVVKEYDGLKVAAPTDLDGFRQGWLRGHPCKECVRCVKKTAERIIKRYGVGRITLYREKIVILYKNKKRSVR